MKEFCSPPSILPTVPPAGQKSRAYQKVLVGLCRLAAPLPRLAGAEPFSPTLVGFVLVTGATFCFLLSNQRTLTNGDTWPVMPSAERLLTAGNWDLESAISRAPACYGRPLPYSVQSTESGFYSRYPAGMVAFAVPVAALAKLGGARLERPSVQTRLEKWTAAAMTATALGLFFLTAMHLVPPGSALVATTLLATGSVLTSSCGQALWQQGGVIFWMLVVLHSEFRLTRIGSVATVAIQGIACAMMLACRLSAALFVLSFAVWLLARTPRRAVATMAIAVGAYFPWAVIYESLYGNLFGPSTHQFDGSWWSWDPSAGAAGLLVSPSRGLLVYQPWLVLVLPGTWLMLRGSRRDDPRTPGIPSGWPWFCAAFVVLHLTLVANWRIWWGGHCWGSRLVAEVVPLLALLALPIISSLWRHRSGRAILLGLAMLSFAVHAPVLYGSALEWNEQLAEGRPEMLWSWRKAPFFHTRER